jgi:DNA polymerase-1
VKEKFYLIDATAYCYRAYYALKGLSTSYGQPTNAVFGFVNFLNKILKQNNPNYLGICFDVSRDTFRQRKFAEYKIQRPQMPEPLVSQIPFIKQIIQAYDIAFYEKAGFEADDLIASLAKRARQEGLDVVIVSSDKDILQLVDEHIVVFNPYKDKGTVYDLKKIKDSFGISPSQIIDLISLAGDSADNIPSVKGVGEKTTVKLIKEFKSIDGILANLEKVKPERLQKAIRESIPQIKMNRSIVKLRSDVELEFNLDKLKHKQPDYSTLYRIYRELEFKSLLGSLPSGDNPSGVEIKQSKGISTISKNIKELVLMCGNQRLALMGLEGEAFSELDIKDIDSQAQEVLSNPRIRKIGHDLKEIKVRLAKQNIRLQGLYFDTMIAAYVLNPSRAGYSLSDLAWDYFKQALDESPNIKHYTACNLVLKLKKILEKELIEKDSQSLFFNLEMPLVDVLVSMQLTGVALDLRFLKALSSDIEKQLIGLVEKIFQFSGGEFNINSPKQLRNVLFERLRLPVQKRTKSGPSTDEEVLSILARQHPLPKMLLEYRKLTKIKSTYVDSLPMLVDSETGRVHACFNQAGTQTGRLSSSNPNLQNIPIKGEIGKQIRKAIIASGKENYLISFDYSQIELRILAHLSGEPQLIKAFKNNQDIHIGTACLIYGLDQKDIDNQMREVAKRINFGIIYGLSSFGLSRDLGISHEEASNFIDAYFLRYPRVREYIQEQIEKAKKYGYVMTILRRRRYIPEISSKNSGIRQFAERQAINTPIQGSAAELIKKAMVQIHQEMQKSALDSKLILQIHDELVFEVPQSESESLIRLVREKMEGCFAFSVPIKVVIKKGKNWLEMEEVK